VILVLPYQIIYQKPLEIRNTLQIQRHFSSFFFVFLRFLLILRTNAHAQPQKTPTNNQKTPTNAPFFNKPPIPLENALRKCRTQQATEQIFGVATKRAEW
jgi:hypothetical protein